MDATQVGWIYLAIVWLVVFDFTKPRHLARKYQRAYALAVWGVFAVLATGAALQAIQ